MVIWKYGLQRNILMPKGAKILSCQEQHGTLVVWAMVDPEAESEVRCFESIVTGLQYLDMTGYTYLATLQQDDGHFVEHIFYK